MLTAQFQRSSYPIYHEQITQPAPQQDNSIYCVNKIYSGKQCEQTINSSLLTMSLQQPSGAICYGQHYKQQIPFNSTLTVEQMTAEDYSACQQNERRSIQQRVDNNLVVY